MAEIGFQHALDRLRRILGFDVVINLAAAGGVRAEAAADDDVIALDLIAVLGHLDLGADAGRCRRCNAARRNSGSR